LSIEFLSDLEQKIETMLQNYDKLRQENVALRGDVEKKDSAIAAIENENRLLKDDLNAIKADSQRHQEKLKAAAEKIQGLIVKMEGV